MVKKPLEERIEGAKNFLKDNLNTVRAGRANPDVLKKITVDYYGSPTPISSIAEIKTICECGRKATVNARITADGRVVTNFIKQALNGSDITIYGDGTQTRSFCYVDDMVRGLKKMMQSPDSFNGPVNLGNPGEFTMLELAELVLKYTGKKSKMVFKPLPSDDPTRRRPDISLAQKELGWQPEIMLHEGLQNTIKYFREKN